MNWVLKKIFDEINQLMKTGTLPDKYLVEQTRKDLEIALATIIGDDMEKRRQNILEKWRLKNEL